MLHERGAHYGSTSAEIAVCTKAVGLIERSDLDLLEVTGASEGFVSRALAAALPGDAPAPGRAQMLADTWCCRGSPERALVAGGTGAVDRWRHVVDRAASTTAISVSAVVLTRGEALSMVGPKARAVLDEAGLPAGIEAGAVAEGEIAGTPLALVCEEPGHYLLLFPLGCPPAALAALLDSGRGAGMARVGHEALAHLRAARRESG